MWECANVQMMVVPVVKINPVLWLVDGGPRTATDQLINKLTSTGITDNTTNTTKHYICR